MTSETRTLLSGYKPIPRPHSYHFRWLGSLFIIVLLIPSLSPATLLPKQAPSLQVLSTQDADISVKILEKIDPTKASKIFNLMDKEVSARLQKQYLNMQK